MQTLLYFNNVCWVYLIYFHGKMTKQETFLVKLPSIVKGLWMFPRSSLTIAAAKGKELGTWHINFNCVWCRMSTRNDFFHAILNRDLQIWDTDSIRDSGEQNMSQWRSLFVTNRTERIPVKVYAWWHSHRIQIQIVGRLLCLLG